ncbi:MAG: S-methyl-5-thioribose-1-phosphate isomerase [Bacteroidales bacterium]
MERVLPYDSVDISSDRLSLILLDQTQLPGKEVFLHLNKENEIFEAISALKVRGAPAIGIAAAYGLCVVLNSTVPESLENLKTKALDVINLFESSRPTAVNLSWALNRMKNRLLESVKQANISVNESIDALFKEAHSIKQEDIAMCERISEFGLSLIKPGMGILTHCNAGHLAVSRLGTALGPVYLANKLGYKIRVYADETRPLLQGARLTAFELMQAGIDVTLICDNVASSVMSQGWVDAVFVGCDRIAKNGDVANKIGTSSLAILASSWKIPFYVLGPTSTIDKKCNSGKEIVIEERPSYEVTELWYKKNMAPEGVKVYNPAFDITKAEFITAIITEKGIFRYPYNFSD